MDCRSMLLLSVLLLSPLVASGLEFTTFLGKTADPCHRYLSWSANGLGGAAGTALPLNCAQNSAVAPRSNTVLWGVNGPLTLPLAAGTQLTINGIGLPKGATNLVFVPVTTDTCPTGAASTTDAALSFTATVNAAGTQVVFQPPTTWSATGLVVENAPRRLCWAQSVAGPWVYTGFKLGFVWNCVNNNECTGDARRSALAAVTTLTPLDRTLKSLETTCCLAAAGAAAATTGRVQGQCVNPNVQGCCGSTAFELAQSRCCSPTLETTTHVGAPCPCTKDADCPALDALSPNPTFCCLPSKYSQTNNPTSGAEGQCVRSKEEGCCDTGSLYDLGSEQCCPISGVQSLNKPCPCSQDTHCLGRVFTTTPAGASTSGWTDINQRCCTQTAPATMLSATTCDANAFFPTGTGAPEVAPCPGTCFDVTYSMCCNGVQCMKNYEVCCNSTCCNRFSGTCLEGLRGGATGRSVNPRDYGLRFQQCSTIEFLSTVKAFWVFVFPAGLLAASLAALALCMVFASKATPRSLSLLEHVMIGAAILTIFLAMPLYFAPVYKYGIWIIFVMMVANLSAAARIKWLNIVTIIVLFITVIYVFDPFFGNAWLTLASNRVRSPAPPQAALSAETDLSTSGLLHSIALSWRSLADQSTNTMNYCVEHYDWFRLDPQLRDVRRYDNPQILTFGYCSRGWTTALIFFSFCVMSLILLQLVLFVLGLFVRFHHDKIELEVHEELAY